MNNDDIQYCIARIDSNATSIIKIAEMMAVNKEPHLMHAIKVLAKDINTTSDLLTKEFDRPD